MIKNFLQRIILKILPVTVLDALIIREKIKRFERQVVMGKNSRLHPEAKVFNMKENIDSIVIGEGSHIRGELFVFAAGGEISIGSNVYIGEGTRIWSAAKIIIGNNVLISHNCNVIDTDSHEIDHIERSENYRNMIKNGHSKVKGNVLDSPIIIEDYAWLSYNVSVLKGVKIGTGAIIAAGSVVTKDVESFSVVAGNPAKVVRHLKN